MNESKHIPIESCKDRTLYRIQARNFKLGVYNKESKSFFGIRTKFGSSFIDSESHWDTGAPYGTAKPVEELCKIPDNIQINPDFDGLFSFLQRKNATSI